MASRMTRPGGRLQEPQTASLRRPPLSHSDSNPTSDIIPPPTPHPRALVEQKGSQVRSRLSLSEPFTDAGAFRAGAAHGGLPHPRKAAPRSPARCGEEAAHPAA